MKEITVQSFVGNKKVEESKMTVQEGEVLVVKYPDCLTMNQINHLHQNTLKALKGEIDLLGVPENTQFLTIRLG